MPASVARFWCILEPMDDFYEDNEPYDSEVAQLKETLRSAVKSEILARLDTLETENKELRDTKRNLEKLTWDVEMAKRDAKADARKARFKEIVDELGEPVWTYDYKDVPRPKCEKCDEDRKLHYLTPRGKESWEWCACHDADRRYELVQTQAIKVMVKGHPTYYHPEEYIFTWARPKYYDEENDDNYDMSSRNVYDGKPFSELNTYRGCIFKDEAQGQAYVDFLNGKKSEP